MPWKRNEKVNIPVKEIGASRALYIDRDTTHVLVRVKSTDDHDLELEMTMRQATKLIEQLMQVHNAVNPPLRTSRGGVGL